MRSGGWKPFWAALGASLLVLLPLVGGTVLLSRQRLSLQLRQAAHSQSGVPIQPQTPDPMTLLICTVPAEPDALPGFLLCGLDAAQTQISLLALPAQLEVTFAQKPATLAECYAAAGPARCRQALMQLFALPEDTHYLALSDAVLQRIADRYGAVRVSLSGALSADQLAQLGQSGAVQALLASDTQELLRRMDADAFSPAATGAVRAAVWDAFVRQNRELLPSTLPSALRTYSSSLLTDLTALDQITLEQILRSLAAEDVSIRAAVCPGEVDAATGRYRLASSHS